MNKILIQKFGISVEISSNNNKFLKFVKKYFSINTPIKLNERADIVLVFNFKPGFTFKLNGNRLVGEKRILGENIGEGPENSFDFCFYELTGKFYFSKYPWQGECIFQKNIFKHFSNLLFFKGRKTEEHYYRFLTRLIIQNLLFMRMQEKGETVILSAAAIEIDGQTKIFAGLPGSGKTTIVKAIKGIIPRANILSENYVLIKEGKVSMFNEGKNPEDNNTYPASEIFIVSRSQEFSVSSIDREEASGMLRAINEYTRELPKHSPFVNNLLLSEKFRKFLDDNYLDKMLASIDSYILVADIGLVKLNDFFKKKYG